MIFLLTIFRQLLGVCNQNKKNMFALYKVHLQPHFHSKPWSLNIQQYVKWAI